METQLQSQGIKNSFTFGCNINNSTYQTLQDVGDQDVIFYGGTNIIYAIQFGNTRYGNSGGTAQAFAHLPPNGVFTLYDIEAAQNGPLRFIRVDINGSGSIQAGSSASNNQRLDISPGLQVKFGGIFYNSNQVNQLLFYVM